MKNSLKIVEIYNNLEKVNTPKNTNILDPYSDKKSKKFTENFIRNTFMIQEDNLFGINQVD